MERIPTDDGTNAGARARALGLGEPESGWPGGPAADAWQLARDARCAVEQARIKAERAQAELVQAERHYLLLEADAETRAMFTRLVAYKALVKACPHRDGWRLWPPGFAQCMACGLVATEAEHDKLSRWPTPLSP